MNVTCHMLTRCCCLLHYLYSYRWRCLYPLPKETMFPRALLCLVVLKRPFHAGLQKEEVTCVQMALTSFATYPSVRTCNEALKPFFIECRLLSMLFQDYPWKPDNQPNMLQTAQPPRSYRGGDDPPTTIAQLASNDHLTIIQTIIIPSNPPVSNLLQLIPGNHPAGSTHPSWHWVSISADVLEATIRIRICIFCQFKIFLSQR